jgi:BioD-like phosphotransacetylase family protein
MSAGAALQSPLFEEESKVVITSGDRSDMIIAALGSNAAAVILTNNIMPPPNLIAKASQMNIPLLLVSADTYEIAKQIEGMESLPTKDDLGKISLLEQMVRDHVDLGAFTQP